MVTINSTTEKPIPANSLPAILVGGPPNAGKSVLTYNLTQALRRRNIPHYVFRANPDIEGDWFLKGNLTTVRQIQLKVWDYRHWSDIFRAFVCRDLARRQLPLIVDLGGLPREADSCIFRVCTHSLLLLKEEDKDATQVWHHFTNGLIPLAEIYSRQHTDSVLVSQEPIITGTLADLERGKSIDTPLFDVLVERVSQLFGSYTSSELEQLQMDAAPIENIVHLAHRLQAFGATDNRWTTNLLRQLLTDIPAHSALAVYGRGPNWLYGALALHAEPQPFYQFDARLGWIASPRLNTSTSASPARPVIKVTEENTLDFYVVHIHPIHNYLDYTETGQLVLPEPPPQRGIVVDGKLPLWLFTALARFYFERDAPWIALNDAHDNRPVVIYSRVASHAIGDILPALI